MENIVRTIGLAAAFVAGLAMAGALRAGVARAKCGLPSVDEALTLVEGTGLAWPADASISANDQGDVFDLTVELPGLGVDGGALALPSSDQPEAR